MGNCSPHPVMEPVCTSPPYFNVYNVDAKLFKHSKGKIKITNEELILQYNNDLTAEIRWVLKGIRRYGYHKDIFLFECGRRCPTGEGLFAFKCNKAKRLNESLKNAIIKSSTTLIDLRNTKHAEVIRDNQTILKKKSTTSKPISIYTNKSDITSRNQLYLEPIHNDITNNKLRVELTSELSSAELVNQMSTELAASSPYYVNDIKNNNNNLVRLPLSLSFVSSHEPNYANNEQVDPRIIHIVTKTLTGSSSNNNANQKSTLKLSSSDSSSLSAYSSSSSSNYPSNLIYVIPERLSEKIKSTNNSQLISDHRSNQYSMSSDLDNLEKSVSGNSSCQSPHSSSNIEYTYFAPNKTNAIEISQQQIKIIRDEYSMISHK